jgi:hypothetical protein
LTQRLGAPWWLGPLLCAALLLASLALLVRAREADTV